MRRLKSSSMLAEAFFSRPWNRNPQTMLHRSHIIPRQLTNTNNTNQTLTTPQNHTKSVPPHSFQRPLSRHQTTRNTCIPHHHCKRQSHTRNRALLTMLDSTYPIMILPRSKVDENLEILHRYPRMLASLFLLLLYLNLQ